MKTKLSIWFLIVFGISLGVYAFNFAPIKATASDLWGLVIGLALAWVIGFLFYHINLFGSQNFTSPEFAELVFWKKRQQGTDYKTISAIVIQKAALAVLVVSVLTIVLYSVVFYFLKHD